MEYFYELGKQNAGFSQPLYDISRNLDYILSWNNIFAGHIAYFPYSSITYNHKTLKFNEGVKPLRILRKVLNFIEFPHMESFEKFCNDISYELTNKSNTMTNLVFSIHPIDFITMSHNTCNWSSCMNWESGCYSNGVLEMMNSNMAVIAYVESSSQDFMVNNRIIPNKGWRCLYYLHKQIICSGKAYPYNNDMLVRKGLDALANLVKKNLSWKYQYENQRYFDMCNFGSNEQARYYIEPKDSNKHNIILYNYAAMYNDLANDHDEKYYCYRNWVPKTLKLCMSGLATCIFCGKPLTSAKEMQHDYCYDDSDFDARGSSKCCGECMTKYYNYRTNKFYLITPQYECRTLNFYRYYDYGYKEYRHRIYSKATALTCSDTENLSQLNKNMPAEAYNILNSMTCECVVSEGSIFYLTESTKRTLYKLLISRKICANEEEAESFFSPVSAEVIASYPRRIVE